MNSILSIVLVLALAIVPLCFVTRYETSSEVAVVAVEESAPAAITEFTGDLSVYASETDPIVTMTMQDGGIIVMRLYPAAAPNTVANFVSLADAGYYDGLTFHRVISGFMI